MAFSERLPWSTRRNCWELKGMSRPEIYGLYVFYIGTTKLNCYVCVTKWIQYGQSILYLSTDAATHAASEAFVHYLTHIIIRKVNSVQEACARCFAVHILNFEILKITWKKNETKNIRPLVFNFSLIGISFWRFLFCF